MVSYGSSAAVNATGHSVDEITFDTLDGGDSSTDYNYLRLKTVLPNCKFHLDVAFHTTPGVNYSFARITVASHIVTFNIVNNQVSLLVDGVTMGSGTALHADDGNPAPFGTLSVEIDPQLRVAYWSYLEEGAAPGSAMQHTLLSDMGNVGASDFSVGVIAGVKNSTDLVVDLDSVNLSMQ
jgi:hypothetical protein